MPNRDPLPGVDSLRNVPSPWCGEVNDIVLGPEGPDADVEIEFTWQEGLRTFQSHFHLRGVINGEP
jgi:hypothetical protein